MPQQFALNVYRGDSYSWSFTLWGDTAGTIPYDLTGVVPKAEIRTRPATPVLVTLGCTVVQPNIVEVELPALDSATMSGKSVWDLQLTFPDSTVKTVVAGSVTVIPDVTDSSTP